MGEATAEFPRLKPEGPCQYRGCKQEATHLAFGIKTGHTAPNWPEGVVASYCRACAPRVVNGTTYEEFGRGGIVRRCFSCQCLYPLSHAKCPNCGLVAPPLTLLGEKEKQRRGGP